MKLIDMEKLCIVATLKESKGNISLAAKQLGIGRTTLYRKCERYKIPVEREVVTQNNTN